MKSKLVIFKIGCYSSPSSLFFAKGAARQNGPTGAQRSLGDLASLRCAEQWSSAKQIKLEPNKIGSHASASLLFLPRELHIDMAMGFTVVHSQHSTIALLIPHVELCMLLVASGPGNAKLASSPAADQPWQELSLSFDPLRQQ